MQFTVRIDDQEYKAAYTGFTARIYREQFKKDFIEELNEGMVRAAASYLQVKEQLGGLNSDDEFIASTVASVTPQTLEQIMWATLFTAAHLDNEPFPLYASWLDSIEDYNGMISVGAVIFHNLLDGPIVRPVVEVIDHSKKK